MDGEKALLNALLIANYYARTGQAYEGNHEMLVARVLDRYGYSASYSEEALPAVAAYLEAS